MKQIILYMAVAVVALVMGSCDSSTFKISADIKGMGNQNLHVVFLGDSGVSDAFIPTQDSKFKIKGSSSELTVVSILDSQNKPLFRLAARGGETLNVTGDINNPHHYKCSGSDVASEWLEFEEKNAQLYDLPDPSKLDAAIEKYVKDNPSSVVSTLLVVVDYSQAVSEKGAKLLASIDADARPESLVASLEQAHELMGKPDKQLQTMTLLSSNGEFEPFVPGKARAMIIYWWNTMDEKRTADIESIKALELQHSGQLAVADVNLSPDTVGWQATLANDATAWPHYWAPGSVLDPSVEQLRITVLPMAIVTDSLGRQLYRGQDLKAAAAAVTGSLK